MSAIGAVYRWDGSPVPVAVVESVLGAMREYGAAGSCWAPGTPEQPVALGCIPRRVTPEDAYYQGPVRSAADEVVVVADARIDNRAEVIAQLGIRSGEACRLSDAAIILAAWQKWQHACPRFLVGDFAFVVWDARTRELFCARDAMGHRLLFYHESPNGVELATTAHALAMLPNVGAALDEQKVADFLVLLQLTDSSFYRGIRRLPPGHTLTASRSGIRLDCYWSPAPKELLRLGSDQAYVDAFLDVFETAVRSQLRSAGTVSMMASGGLDSSSVAAVAAQQLQAEGRSLALFHAAPREGYVGPVPRGYVTDESGDVAALASMYPNIELHVRRTDGRTPLDDLETTFAMTGAPPRNPRNAAWFFGIYERAAAAGTSVLLTGNKGNATISQTGLRSLRDSAVRGQWRRVWREVSGLSRATGTGRREILRREVLHAVMPHAISAVQRRIQRTPETPIWDVTGSAINPDFAHAMNVEERIRAANRHHHDLHRQSEMEWRLTVLAAGGDAYDLYSGFRPWFGIETRDPTADRRVVEFCMAVPGSQYLHNGVTRSLIRRAMEGRVPDQIRLRSAIGWQSADWPEWLPLLRGELSAELNRLETSDTARRCLDLPRLRSLIDAWPERLRLKHEEAYARVLLRGITMGRFIRWFEGTYA